MNISTVAQNLRNTIAGKEFLLSKMQNGVPSLDPVDLAVSTSTQKYLQINIDELYRILADVEKCVAKDVEQSWRDNPDRMGGQFTQDEIDNAGRW
jgi:hypothetical protein